MFFILLLVAFVGLFVSWQGGKLSVGVPARADNIAYVYDLLGRVVQATNSTTSQAMIYAYDAAGNITSQRNVTLSTLALSTFSPAQGPVGTQVKINGTGFSTTLGSNVVKFNGTTATVTAATATLLTATVPSGATTGPISVTVSAVTVTSAQSFVVGNSIVPTITSFTPTMGTVGTPVTIAGTNFEAAALNKIRFNATGAQVTSATATSISTSVPAGASSGKIRVTTPRGVAVSAADFFVIPSGFSSSNVSSTGRVATDATPFTATFSAASKISLQLFEGTAGDLLSLGVSSTTIANSTITVFKPDGTQLVSQVVTASGQGIQLPKLPLTGTYTILINPGSNTGAITLVIYQPLQATLTLNAAATNVNLTPPGRRARLTFSGTQGAYVTLNLSSVTLSAGTVSMMAPNGAVLLNSAITTSGASLSPQLPSAGTYTVLIEPTGSIAGAMNVAVSSSLSPTLTTNQEFTQSSNNLNPLNLTFRANSGQYLSIGIGVQHTTSIPAITGVAATIIRPDGSTLATKTFESTNCTAPGAACSTWAGSTTISLGPLEAGGTYKVSLQQTGAGGNGTISVTVAAPVGGSLAANSATSDTLSLYGQGISRTFTGAAGEYLSLGVSVLNQVAAKNITQLTATVLGPNGAILVSQTFSSNNCTAAGTPCSGWAGSTTLALGPLLFSGTYTLLIQQVGAAGIGSTSITLAYPQTGTLAINTLSTATASLSGQGVVRSFNGTQGEYLSIGVGVSNQLSLPTITAVLISAYKPDGTFLVSKFFTSVNCVAAGSPCSGWAGSAVLNLGAIPVSGLYTVLIQQVGSAGKGTISTVLARPVTGSLVTNMPSNSVASQYGQGALWAFTGTLGQNAKVEVGVLNQASLPTMTNVSVSVLKPDGTELASGTFLSNNCVAAGNSPCSGKAGSIVLDIGPLTIAGVYKVLIEQIGAAGAGTFAVQFTGNPTNTGLTASSNPVAPGAAVTLSASVSGLSPTGNVTFKNGANTISSATLAAGVAALPTSGFAAGVHLLSATYAGDNANAPSTSSQYKLWAVTAQPTTSSFVIPPSTSTTVSVGASQPLKVKVAPVAGGHLPCDQLQNCSATSYGIVRFVEGGITLGDIPVTYSGAGGDYTALYMWVPSSTGTKSITAQYLGTPANSASSANTSINVVVPAPTTTVWSSGSPAPNPAPLGGNVSYVARVSTATYAPALNGGTVNFMKGTTLLGSGTLSYSSAPSNWVATFYGVADAIGTHSITAQFVGQGGYGASTSSAASLVVTNPLPSTTTWSPTPTSPSTGSMNLRVIVTTPTYNAVVNGGTVTFRDGATVLGTSTITFYSSPANWVATLPVSGLATGTHNLTAEFMGKGGYGPSTTSIATVVVN